MSAATVKTRGMLARVAVGGVGLAVVAASTVALSGAGSADASTRAASGQVGVSAAAAAPTSPDQVSYTAPIAGSVVDGRQVTGSFRPTLSKVDDGVLMVRGRVRAAIHNLDGSVTRVTKYRVWMPARTINGNTLSPTAARRAAAAPAAGACPVLNLVLGPLDLDLLGLQVHLDRVVLDIVAQSGAGNLLGNLLCAVAGLLDNAGPLSGLLTQISALLNSILAILQT
jgi:hypothetical protein